MELTTQLPRCRSDDRAHVNTPLSHQEHAFDSHRRRRSRGDETRPFRGNFQHLSPLLGKSRPRGSHACDAHPRRVRTVLSGSGIVDALSLHFRFAS